MQILTKVKVIDNLTSPANEAAGGELAKELKDKAKKFLSFAEAPFATEVVIVETAEDQFE